MAKGQMRTPREKKKPKQEKKEKAVSAYQQAYNQRPGGNTSSRSQKRKTETAGPAAVSGCRLRPRSSSW